MAWASDRPALNVVAARLPSQEVGRFRFHLRLAVLFRQEPCTLCDDGRVIVLDGSEGEGGGQVLRSALSLSLITGQPFRLEKVRAKRKPPGLKAQHLTCVQGAAKLGEAEVEGDSLGSHQVTFHPKATKPGAYAFHVGTAGSTNLLFHCLVYPLALAGGGSLTLTGGSHVIASPSFDYVARVWAPLVKHWGFSVRFKLEAAGFFPEGGGRLWVQVEPVGAPRPIDLSARTPIDRFVVRSIVGGLPLEIASRQGETARRALNDLGVPVELDVESLPVAHSKGTAVLVTAETKGQTLAGFSSLGERRVPAEEVGRLAATQARAWLRGAGSLDEHAGDQVLLPMGLAAAGLLGAPQPSRFKAHVISDHLTTHAKVLEAFLPIRVTITNDLVEVLPR